MLTRARLLHRQLYAVLTLGPLGVFASGCSGSVEVDCTSAPEEIDGDATGYALCGVVKHRPTVETCPAVAHEAPPECSEVTEPNVNDCATDADCTERPNGFCGYYGGGGELPGCTCSYGCLSDDECGTGQVCVCSQPYGYCATARCTSDADCSDEGSLCAYTRTDACDYGSSPEFGCLTPDDECIEDDDCGGTDLRCVLGADGIRTCKVGENCAVPGRPFIVEDEARVAPCVSNVAWRERVDLDVSDLEPFDRRAVRDHWVAVGLLEHASVAAFARFTLQLLAVGAPAELVERSCSAMADETRHARLAFGVASAFATEPLGPGALSIDGALDDGDLRSIVRTTVREGVIGETLAALEAAAASDAARDPEIRRILREIADDEARHAELAVAFVAWALARDASLARDILAELAAHLDRIDPTTVRGGRRLEAWGVLSTASSRAVRGEAFDHVVLPLMGELVGMSARAEASHAPLSSRS